MALELDGYEATRRIRASPGEILPGAKSVVCLSAAHAQEPRVASDGSRIARYAVGPDYHGTLRDGTVRKNVFTDDDLRALISASGMPIPIGRRSAAIPRRRSATF